VIGSKEDGLILVALDDFDDEEGFGYSVADLCLLDKRGRIIKGPDFAACGKCEGYGYWQQWFVQTGSCLQP
jgi:hypothetical protein